MKNNTWQIQSAKNRLSEVIKEAVKGKPQLITKNGEPVAYIININTYNKKILNRTSKKETLLNRPHKEIDLDLIRDKDTGRDIIL
jgi:antitoxin Phd